MIPLLIPIKSRITRKAMTLFTVILFTEVLFIGILAWLMQQISEQIEDQASTTRILTDIAYVQKQAQELTMDMFDVCVGEKGDFSTSEERIQQTSSYINLPKAGDALAASLGNKAPDKKLVSEMQGLCTSIVPGLVKSCTDPNSNKQAILPSLETALDELLDRLQNLNEYFGHDHEEENAELKFQTNLLIGLSLFIGVGLNVAVAFLLYNKLIAGMASRIESVSHDISMMASGQPLPERNYGNDEIADLARELRLIAANLEEFRSKERALLDAVASVICSVDENGCFVTVGPGCSALWGYRPDDIIGKRFTSIVSKDDYEDVYESLKTLFAQKADVQFECTHRKKNGYPIELAWKARLSGDKKTAVLVAQDVTERNESLRKIWQSQQEFRDIVDRMPISVITTDENFNIRSINTATQVMFNSTPTDLLSRNLNYILSGGTTGGAQFEQVRTLMTMAETQPVELSINRPNADSLPVELNSRSYVDQTQLRTYLATFRDISVRMEIERVKRDFVAMISHDLRSPLTALFGTLETMVEDGKQGRGTQPAAQSGAPSIATANSIVSNLVSLINDFLDLEKFEAGMGVLEVSSVSVSDLIHSAIEQVKIGASSVVFRETAESNVMVNVDRERISFSIANFIMLVTQFSKGKTTIRVWQGMDKSFATVSITGDGFHLPPDVRESCMSRYAFTGSGAQVETSSILGLALSRAVLNAHQGTVAFESEGGIESVILQIPSR